MEKDYSGGIHLHGLLHHDPRVNRGAIDGALEQLTHNDDPVTVIEK